MYSEIYYHDYCIESDGSPARLSILKRDYTGPSIYVDAGPVPFIKALSDSSDDTLGGIYPTMGKIQLLGDENFGMDDLYTADDAEFRVVHTIAGEVDWTGFMTPESFGEEDTCDKRYLNINAFDGLTRLKDIKFLDADGSNYGTSDGVYSRTVLFAIKEALLKTELSLPFHTLIDRQVVEATITYQKSVPVNVLDTGWAYSQGFINPPNVAVGNYIRYKWDGNTSYTVSRIEQIDDSDIPSGGGRGLLLNPPMSPVQLGAVFDFGFFAPTFSTNQDVLGQVEVDMRVWVDPGADFEPQNKQQQEFPYFMFTAGTYTTWDVLDALARTFDFKVSQEKGEWSVMAVDAHRVDKDLYVYSSQGVLSGRRSKPAVKVMPDDSSTQYRFDGNTRYFGKTLKSANVNYEYRYKIVGDELDDLLLNGDLSRYTPFGPPASYTPPDWQRIVLGSPITFNVDILVLNEPKRIEISSPSSFNSLNRLRPLPEIKVQSGDQMFLSWMQQIREFLTGGVQRLFYNTMVINLITDSGVNYYLVNSGDQPGWLDQAYMSPNPTGQWLREDGTRIWHFNSNYADTHNPDVAGNFTPMSRVNLKMDAVPESGRITVDFVGVAMAYFNEDGRALAYSYRANGFEDGKIVYVEDQIDLPMNIRFYKGDQNYDARVRIADVSLTRVTSEASGGKGRSYSYTQEANYVDTTSVTVLLGDEDNVNHISTLTVGGRVNDLWIDSSGSLGVGSIGMLLARSILRRQYRPLRHMDGSIRLSDPSLAEIIDLYNDGRLYSPKNIDINSKFEELSGSFNELSTQEIPYGGLDGGAGSMVTSGSSSSGGSSGSSSAPVATSNSADLQKVTDRGASTTRVMAARGTRNQILLSVPAEYPPLADQVVGDRYLHTNEGYAYINNEKVKAGIADSWAGADQTLRKEDSPTFDGLYLSVKPAPETATAEGTAGEVRITEGFIYVCIATNTWLRTPLNTW